MVKCTKRQVRRLKTALRWKGRPEQRQRIQMVLLREGGMTQPAIAEAMGVSLSTVNRAHMAYDQGGLKALKPKPIGGRQRENMTLTEEKALLDRFAKAACAFRRSRPLIPTDRDHLFRSIATSLARVLIAPLDDDGDVSLLWVGQARREAAPVVHRRDPRSPRSALWLTQRRARGVPVDPPGRPENWACRSFLVSFCWLGWRTCARGGFLRG